MSETANEPGGRESRSQARRVAAQKGLPTPDFSAWSHRIPAAIAKAEGLFQEGTVFEHFRAVEVGSPVNRVAITANQVALAKALWDAEQDCTICDFREEPCRRYTPLVAFTETVESLS